MSTLVAAIKEQVERLEPSEQESLFACFGYVPEISIEEEAEILDACEAGHRDFLAGRVLTAEQLLESVRDAK
jgi:predicted transcriptional regulator